MQLPCPHHCRCPMFHQASHRWPQLVVRPHIRAVRPPSEQRLAGRPPTHPCSTEASGLTVSQGGLTSATPPLTEPTISTAPHVTLLSSPTPRVAPTSQLYPLHYSRHPRATREPLAPPLHQLSPLVKAVLVTPSINPHSMTTQVKQCFQLSVDRLTLSATSASTLSPVPSSIRIGAAP
jgi:hypothetical protein